MATKYIKFGLRADRNLADLENPGEALSNLLNDISTQVDENGTPTGFTTSDLSPVLGLRNTGLADNVTSDGTSADLLSLNNSLVTYTPISSPDTTLEVQPRVTLQDNISNFRTVLVDPPWVNGGDGPIAVFIPSDRINPSVSANTNGNSAAVAVTSGALGNNLYSTLLDENLFPIIEGEDFWNNGVFQLDSKLHPTFPNTYGMIQWTGYLSAQFSQQWESTGLFLIEQDLINNGTDNNWITLKNVYSDTFIISDVSWTNDGTTTTLLLGSTDVQRLAQVKAICRGMKVTLDATEYEITSVNEASGSCTILGALTGSNASVEFNWSLSDDLVRTGTISIDQPRVGGKTRVRYTVWWPNPSDLGLPANSTYRTKRFAFAIENSDRLPFAFLYSTYDPNQGFGQYTYEYFKDNRASFLKQDSAFVLRVNNTISMNYTPPNELSSIVKSMGSGATTVTPRTFDIVDTYGKLEGNFADCVVGDWLVFSIGSNYYTFQIEEINSSTIVYVTESLLTITGSSTGTTIANGIIFKNLGLIGLFRLESAGGTQGALYPILGTAVSPDYVYPDYIATGILLDGTSGFKPLRITDVSAKLSNPKTITTLNYLSNGSTLPSTATHICAVYSSRGLEDLSSVDQCKGVYGREVDVTASGLATAITLTTNSGVSVGDFVQYAGAGGVGDPVITEGTTVSSLSGSTVVNLSAGIRAGKTLNKAATVIFIKAADRSLHGTDNKEYCVIPLNTAPPFEGTDLGLVTTAINSNLIVKNFKFAKLDLTVPSANIETVVGATSSSQYFPFIYNGNTYKALIS
jgi:hypothetical protein